MAGWIKIHRDITKHWIFQDAEKFKWWIDLLLTASHEDNKFLMGDRLIEVKRGQQIISLSFLANRWNTSKRTALRFLKLLESDGMCNRCTHQKVTVLTICNYESYQEVENVKVTDDDTDRYPIGNQSVTELKNVEECIRNNNTNPARTREENVSWDSSRERGFYESFKGQGSAIPFAKTVGKTPTEVMSLLDVYMAERELKNKGHKDYKEFISLFHWHVKNKKVSLPVEEKAKSKGKTPKELGWI